MASSKNCLIRCESAEACSGHGLVKTQCASSDCGVVTLVAVAVSHLLAVGSEAEVLPGTMLRA